VPSAEAFARLAARIREERDNVERVVSDLGDALSRLDAGPKDVVTTHGVGGLLHDLYTGVEKMFTFVAPEVNGDMPSGDARHRELLHAMALDMPGVRPPVLRRDTEQALVELLKFRHVYRNMDGFRLRWGRVRELAEAALALWPEVRGDVDQFIAFLDALAMPPR
jgi:hypothetical protein